VHHALMPGHGGSNRVWVPSLFRDPRRSRIGERATALRTLCSPSDENAQLPSCFSAYSCVIMSQVVLCLILLLLALAVWHWRQCGERRTTEHTESLLAAGERGVLPHLGRLTYDGGRGRTSIDSTVSCIVCMDYAINCVLMPCAHEVACQRCASRLGLCPICRTVVGSTLPLRVLDAADRERALQVALRGSGFTAPAVGAPPSSGTLPPPVPAESEAAADPGGVPTDTAALEEGAAGGGAPQPEPKPAMAPMLCLRCAKNPPNCVFLPCSHKVWCNECAEQLPPACPICDTGVCNSLRTFHKRL
jgi:hypothetical protein